LWLRLWLRLYGSEQRLEPTVCLGDDARHAIEQVQAGARCRHELRVPGNEEVKAADFQANAVLDDALVAEFVRLPDDQLNERLDRGVRDGPRPASGLVRNLDGDRPLVDRVARRA